MILRCSKLFVLTLLLMLGAEASYSQPDTVPDASTRLPGERRRGNRPFGMDEMLSKQRVAKAKKEHEQLLERGDQALRLATQLEASFAQNKGLSQQDKDRLEYLEEVVRKIRKELGADDDEGIDVMDPERPIEETRPSTIEEGFRYLQKSTLKLVDELKKTTRFSISAIAIQSSNSVLKLVKFLRLKK